MPWLELKIDAPSTQVEQLSELLSEAGAVSVTWQDAADQPLFEPAPGQTPLWSATRVIGLFPVDTDLAGVVAHVESALGTSLHGWRADPLADQDWERAWMDEFKPMRFGRRLWICPSWHTPPEPQAVNILLDPGLAFGTGTHPTTALCLEWLDAQRLSDRLVIDYGCGSGILAIAAARLGAREVWAVDNDPQALQATRVNAERNAVNACIHTCFPEQLPALRADVLVANILAGPLQELAIRFGQLVRAGGTIALSGILAAQGGAVSAAYEPWFAMARPTRREDWVRLEGRRK